MGNLATVLVCFESCGTCGKCGCPMAFESHFLEQRRNDGSTFYCPNGHPRAFRESELAKAQKLLETERKWRMQERELRDAAERREAAAKGQVTKLKNRVGNGVCPCCNRSFTNLRRHMGTKHPEYKDGK